MNVNVIIFDLDDTLYNEIDYVKSGFREVSRFFSECYNIEYESYLKEMIRLLEKNGRGSVFDDTLRKFGVFSKKNVKKSISIYRQHEPELSLPKNSKFILDYFFSKNISLYIVTDGNKIVQANKVKSLDLEKYTKRVFITHRFGKKYAKPSTYCFEKIARLENMNPQEIVYIGDNINKDFVNLKKSGFKTIRIRQGMFKDVYRPKAFHADFDIENILELKNSISIKN